MLAAGQHTKGHSPCRLATGYVVKSLGVVKGITRASRVRKVSIVVQAYSSKSSIDVTDMDEAKNKRLDLDYSCSQPRRRTMV